MAAIGGYDVGTAFVAVVPSFDNTQRKINQFFARMKPLDIPARLDPKAFGHEVQKAAQQAAKNATVDLGKAKVDMTDVARQLSSAAKSQKVTVTAGLDTSLYDARVRELAAKRISVVAKIDADIAGLQAKIDALASETPSLRVDLETTAAEAKMKALEAEKHRVQIQVDADAEQAMAELLAVDRELSQVNGKTANINVESSSASRAIGIMGLLTAGIAAAGYAAPAAAAAIAAIPAAISVAGQGIGALLFALNGIGDAVKAYQAADDESVGKATSNAKARAAAANSVASAQSSLASAQASADHTAVSGAESVAAARATLARSQDAYAQAQETALRRTQDAERGLTEAQRSAKDSQDALNEARKEARERIEDLTLSLKGAALDEESAALALEKAQAKLQALKDAGATEGVDYREADLNARQAAQRLDEVRERYADLQEQAASAAKSGVEGDRAVIAAHKAADAATARVADAERSLSEARTDGARQVAQAQAQVAQSAEAVALAQEHAAWANEAAVKAVADAQRNLAEASQKAGEDGTAAMDKLNLALSKLTPEGRAFAYFLQREVKPALHDVGDAVQAALLPRMETAIRNLITLGPELTTVLTGTADVIGELAVKGSEMMSSGPWRRDFLTIGRNNNRIMESLGNAGLSIADAFRNITVAAGPMLNDFAIIADNAASAFAAFIQGKRDSGELTKFFDAMGGELKILFGVLKDVAIAIWDLGSALGPLVGSGLIQFIDALAQLISGFVEANPLLTNILTIAGLAATAFIYFGRSIIGTYGAFKKGRQGFDLLLGRLGDARDQVQKVADGTSRLAGAADAVVHPVSRARQAISDLAQSYREGAAATRRWLDSQSATPGTPGGGTRLLDNIQGKVRSIASAATETGTKVAAAASAAANALLNKIGAASAAAADKVGVVAAAVSDKFDAVVSKTRDIATAATDVAAKITAAAGATASSLLNKLGPASIAVAETFEDVARATGVTAVKGFEAAREGAGRFRDALHTAVIDPVAAANGALDRIATGLYGTGTALREGISSAAAGARTALDTTVAVAGRVKDAVASAAETVRTGFVNAVKEGASATVRLADSVRTGLSAAVTTVGEGVRNSVSNISTIIANAGGGIRSGLSKALEGAKAGLGNIAEVAGGAAKAIGTGVVKAVDGLVGAFGGPWSIALAGAFIGFELLTQHSQEAAKALEANKKRVDDLAAALRESKGAIDANVRSTAASALADFDAGDGKRNLLEDARKLGIELPKLTDAYLGNGDAVKQIATQLRATADAHAFYHAGKGSSVKDFDDIGKAANQLADIIEKEGGNFQNAAQKNRDLAEATGPVIQKTVDLTDAQIRARDATAGFNEKLTLVRNTTNDVATAGQALLDFLDQLQGKVPSVDDAADRLNTDIRKLAGGLKDSEGNAIDFSKGLVKASGEIDTTSDAGSQLRASITSLATDMAGAGKAAFDQARALGKDLPTAYQAAKAAMDPYVTRVHDALKANGATEDQISRLLGYYNLVPPKLATTILLAGDKLASEQVADVLGNLQQLPAEVPVHVQALTGVAQESLIQLGYHIVQLPDGSFKVFSNTDIGQKQADDFVAHNNGRPISLEMAVKTAQAQQDLDRFKEMNKSFDLHPVLTNAGKILYTGPDGDTKVFGTNLRMSNALGRIIEFYANGGFNQLNPMSADVAAVVPPNTMRVIGDRPAGDEAFIPINRSSRSIEILMETAKRMGFALSPLALGGLLGFAGGAVAATGGATSSATASAPDPSASADSMTAAAAAADALAAALGALQVATIAYTTTALVPQVDELNNAVVPALNLLSSTLTPVQRQYWLTSSTVATTTASMVASTAGSVAQITGQLAVLRAGLTQTGQAFANTASWVNSSWSQMRGYAQGPTRDILLGPVNAGLISAWNFLDASFGLNHHLNPVAVPFSQGGPVHGPGTGTSDSVLARLSNGEYVLPAELTKRILPFLEALRGGQAEALQAAGYAQGGIVADTGSALNAAVARAKLFAAAQQGKPYVWGGVGPNSYDCSGFMSAISNVLRGEANPYRRLGVAASEPWPGFVRGLSSAFAMGASSVHTAGTLGGVNAESTGNHVRFGGDAHGADDYQFTVQSSLPLAGGTFVSGGGNFDPAALVASAFTDTAAMVQDVRRRYPGNIMAGHGGGEVNYASNALQKLAVDQLAVNTIGGGPEVQAAKQFARTALARFGWGQDQFPALDALWTGESGWNYRALNKSSGAFGIAQALPAEKYASQGPDWRTNPATQILWGLNYIKQRPDYGSPSAAYSRWLGRSPHWYDDGGWLPPGYSTVANHTGQPEAVLTQDQWNALSTMAGLNTGGTGRNVTVYARTDASPEHIAHVIDRRLAIGSRL